MTYELIETSANKGTPVELYEFSYTGASYLYTSAAEPVEVGNKTYEPFPIQRSSLALSDDTGKQDLSVEMPRTAPVAEIFRVAPPSEPVTLTLSRRHLSDTANEIAVLWVGRVLNASWKGDVVSFHAESALTSLGRKVARRRFSPTCPHQLYGEACGVNKVDHKVVGTVTSINGSIIGTSISDKPKGWFDGGYIEWRIPQTARFEIRSVFGSLADGSMTLSAFPSHLEVGMEFDAYPGCDHTLATCKTKFNNELNFGGFPFVPSKNPFGGSPIY